MLLAIDVGNTQTVIGLFAEDRDAGPDLGLLEHWRLATEERRTADEIALMLKSLLSFGHWEPKDVTGVSVSSVVPRATAALRNMIERYFPVRHIVVEPGVKTGMPILYENPKEVGADRIANAVAAFEEYGGPTVVVDFGTATTFDAISAKGEYLGGAIAPGIDVSSRALFAAAAGLRRVEFVRPRNVIGRNTVESIQSGIVYGFAGQVDAMVGRLLGELGGGSVIATGGLAQTIGAECQALKIFEPWLTLKGLRIIHERNE